MQQLTAATPESNVSNQHCVLSSVSVNLGGGCVSGSSMRAQLAADMQLHGQICTASNPVTKSVYKNLFFVSVACVFAACPAGQGWSDLLNQATGRSMCTSCADPNCADW